ncbi:DNA topoisomerase 1 beta-like isoform X3 [Phalaenopsis equestris]|uniref:DNA topoisomerase 1 beta-like isoform X3 n=1 Tax=Phalaenopsis equestris TaxID=78828 RepID=UPI0009E53A3B|nr:DNA topoisomerase 1 beta-like isoform X3 [Phalaenopsis equestris]
MAVHSCVNQVFSDNGEDDDGPAIFKRTNPSSKQNQLNSSSRKLLSSQNSVGFFKERTSSMVHASKDKSLGMKDTAAPSSKISSEKSKSVSSNASFFVHDNAIGSAGQNLVSRNQMKASHSGKIFVAENSVSQNSVGFIAERTSSMVHASKVKSLGMKKDTAAPSSKISSEKFKSVSSNTSSFVHDNASKDKSLGMKKDTAAPSSKISSEKSKSVSSNASSFVHDNAIGSVGQNLVSRDQMKASHSGKSFVAENSVSQNSVGFIAERTSSMVHASKDKSLGMKKDTAAPSSKISSEKSKSVSSNASSFVHDNAIGSVGRNLVSRDQMKASHSGKSFVAENSDDSIDNMPLSFRISSSSKGNNSTAVLKAPKQSMASGLTSKSSVQTISGKARSSDGSDDDDNVPLSAKFISASLAPHSSNSLLAAKVSIKESASDSEDEKPLLSRLQAKIEGAASIKLNSNENFFPSKIVANGYAKKESIDGLTHSKGSSKRPFDDNNNSAETSVKKAKLLDGSSSIKFKREELVNKEQMMDDDHIPISQRMKKTVFSGNQVSVKNEIKKTTSFKKDGKQMRTLKDSKYSKSSKVPPGSGGGLKWTTLEHNGVIFPPPYNPHGIKMLYNGQPVDLTPEQEEVATMFAVMKDTDYATKPKFIDFIENFMNDWRQILGKNHVIKKFELCDFTPIYEWHLREKEKKKQMSSEEKKQLKEDKMKQEEKYMWAIVDGVKEKVGNFRVEPPGLFRGRGEHPKMGKLKRRIRPRDITINIGKSAPIPECPIPGERWKEVKRDNTVTWLAYWSDPVNSKEYKYVFLAASSSLKGQSDKEKYEKARMLKKYIQNIRANYTKDFTSKDATKRQIAVATYLIDKLALRAGNEKDDDEADTVGCCTLKVENVTLLPPNKLQFDFLGKDSIRYFNTVEVELPVYKAIGEFQSAKRNDGRKKADGDDLFDLLDTSKLNAHLKELMPGLTAKVFRTYNASITLDDMLSKETTDGNVLEKVAVYQIANKEVAIICNHQRSVSKSHDAQMSRLDEKINELKDQRKDLEVDLGKAKRGKPLGMDADGKLKKNVAPELLEKRIIQIDHKIEKMELSKKTKEDLKTVALGTSKINYLDPRISVAWCKRNEVPIEKIFNKSLLAKFAWAMDVDPEFRF